MAAQLNGKVAIVTGSSSGLGEAIALLFAARGASVTLCGRDGGRLQSVYDKAVGISGGHKERFIIVQGDLNDQEVRENVVSQTVKAFGQLDILVANAGISDVNCSLLDANNESYNNIMDSNVKSVFFLIQQAVPHLQKTKGTIITVSSIASTLPSTTAVVYSMSKAALDHLTHCLAVDLGSKGIRVNSVNPSFIETRILRFLGGDVDTLTKNRVEFESTKCMLQGRVGIPDDVAEAVAFLASDAAGFITGQNLKIDGGRGFGEPNGWSATKSSH
ncbi:hypothetical protein BsWGS_12364 [Bradybaena similaris]